MAAPFPRGQAARLGALLNEHFAPGLSCVEAPPRRGKSDLLLQLFHSLQARRGVAPVLLGLAGRRVAPRAAEQAAAQLLAFHDAAPASPFALLNRERLAEREDAWVWHEFLAACDHSFCAERFFAALAALAEGRGRICVLLDDAGEDALAAASSILSPALAVIAVPRASIPAGARVVPLEEFSVREALLLTEGLARAFGVPFSGAAAEPFVAYAGQDPYTLESVVRAAADQGIVLKSREAFIAAYCHDLARGTLGAYFRSRFPGKPGSLERRFALEAVASGAVDSALLSRWRYRLPAEQALSRMRDEGWCSAAGSGWVIRDWPAARDWAVLQTAGGTPEAAAGIVTVRLLAGVDEAGRAASAGLRDSYISAGLRGLQPNAAAWLAEHGGPRAAIPEICHVAVEELGEARLYLCYGFAGGLRRIESAALLAVAVADRPADLAGLLEKLRNRARSAAPPAAAPAATELWLVLKAPGPGERQQAEQAGARVIDFDLFNRLINASPQRAADDAAGQVVLKLPMTAEVELLAVRVLDHLLERHGWDARGISQARMALVEACLNAVEHSRAAEPDLEDAQIEVRLQVSAAGLGMIVSNPGAPFDPEGTQQGSALHRGHGLKIIHSLMDSVSFSSGLNGTSLHMWKRSPANAAGATAGCSEDEKPEARVEAN